MTVFTLDCETSSDESSFLSNSIEEFSDSDDEDSNDGCLKATVIPTQIEDIVNAREVIPILSPEIKEPTDEVFELAVSLKNGDEELPYSTKELSFIKNCARLEKKYGKSMNAIEKRFFKTIQDYGSVNLKKLLEFETDGLSTKRKFYNALKGKRCEKSKLF